MEQRNTDGQTPLFAAARRGDVDAVRALLKAGANVQASDANHQNSLFSGLESKSKEICRLLLAHGADPLASAQVPKKGTTPTEHAKSLKIKWWSEVISEAKT